MLSFTRRLADTRMMGMRFGGTARNTGLAFGAGIAVCGRVRSTLNHFWGRVSMREKILTVKHCDSSNLPLDLTGWKTSSAKSSISDGCCIDNNCKGLELDCDSKVYASQKMSISSDDFLKSVVIKILLLLECEMRRT